MLYGAGQYNAYMSQEKFFIYHHIEMDNQKENRKQVITNCSSRLCDSQPD